MKKMYGLAIKVCPRCCYRSDTIASRCRCGHLYTAVTCPECGYKDDECVCDEEEPRAGRSTAAPPLRITAG